MNKKAADALLSLAKSRSQTKRLEHQLKPKADEKSEALVAALDALLALEADRAYQKLTGGKYFTSAPTEQEWKQESREEAWAKVQPAVSKILAALKVGK